MSKTISGIVTWLKQWFYPKDDVYDSGWQGFPFRDAYNVVPFLYNGKIETLGFSSMSGDTLMKDYSSSQPVRVRRIGKVVHIEGTMTSDINWADNSTPYFPLKELCCGEHNSTTYNGDYYFTVGTLSEEFRPSDILVTVQQGSGINRYALKIYPNGAVKIGRYGVSSYVNPQEHPWLSINITYTVE